jgi:hypothetical protein
LRGHSAIYSMIFFSQERVYALDILLFTDQHGSTSVATLLVRTVEYGVLKTHMHCMKILCIRQNRVLVGCVSKTDCWIIVI